MLSVIEKVNDVVNNFIWGVPAMICIIGVGLLLSFRTGFIQIRKFPYAMKVTLGRMLKKREASDGALTPFQAVCTALAATVGTGNVAGVAGAIAIGGPGAVFWNFIKCNIFIIIKHNIIHSLLYGYICDGYSINKACRGSRLVITIPAEQY